MKLADVKAKIDNYFNNTSSEEIMHQFEQLGYIFLDAPIIIDGLLSEEVLPFNNYDAFVFDDTKVSIVAIPYDYLHNNAYSIAA